MFISIFSTVDLKIGENKKIALEMIILLNSITNNASN